jgi:hypothetical protein
MAPESCAVAQLQKKAPNALIPLDAKLKLRANTRGPAENRNKAGRPRVGSSTFLGNGVERPRY